MKLMLLFFIFVYIFMIINSKYIIICYNDTYELFKKSMQYSEVQRR